MTKSKRVDWKRVAATIIGQVDRAVIAVKGNYRATAEIRLGQARLIYDRALSRDRAAKQRGKA